MNSQVRLPSRYRVEKVPTLAEALSRIWTACLFINDEETSRVMDIVAPWRDNAACVRDVWIVVDMKEENDVGMAMVTDPAEDSDGRPVLNLYVGHDHQRQGLGRALLNEVLQMYDRQWLAAYYTLDAVRLYHEAGLIPAELIRSDPVLQHLKAGNLAAARARHIESRLADRADRDREEAQRRAIADAAQVPELEHLLRRGPA